MYIHATWIIIDFKIEHNPSLQIRLFIKNLSAIFLDKIIYNFQLFSYCKLQIIKINGNSANIITNKYRENHSLNYEMLVQYQRNQLLERWLSVSQIYRLMI